MKLKEFMEQYDKPYMIGIAIHCNFCFIGTKDEYDKVIKAVNESFRERHLTPQNPSREVKEKEPYVDLWDREVIDTYLTEVYKTFVVRIVGEESAKYWFRSEFLKDYGRYL